MVTVNFRLERHTQSWCWIPRIRTAANVNRKSVHHFQTHCCRSWFENLFLTKYRNLRQTVTVECRPERGLEDLILWKAKEAYENLVLPSTAARKTEDIGDYK